MIKKIFNWEKVLLYVNIDFNVIFYDISKTQVQADANIKLFISYIISCFYSLISF